VLCNKFVGRGNFQVFVEGLLIFLLLEDKVVLRFLVKLYWLGGLALPSNF
jgi:hypothetical protein